MRKTIILSNKTADNVKDKAKQEGINQSQFIEIAILHYLNAIKQGVDSNGK